MMGSIHSFTERFAQRFGIRTLEITGVTAVASLAAPDLSTWMIIHSLDHANIMTKPQLIGLLATTTALYEAAFQLNAKLVLPTFSQAGLTKAPTERLDNAQER